LSLRCCWALSCNSFSTCCNCSEMISNSFSLINSIEDFLPNK
jgi:hypothetical protein